MTRLNALSESESHEHLPQQRAAQPRSTQGEIAALESVAEVRIRLLDPYEYKKHRKNSRR